MKLIDTVLILPLSMLLVCYGRPVQAKDLILPQPQPGYFRGHKSLVSPFLDTNWSEQYASFPEEAQQCVQWAKKEIEGQQHKYSVKQVGAVFLVGDKTDEKERLIVSHWCTPKGSALPRLQLFKDPAPMKPRMELAGDKSEESEEIRRPKQRHIIMSGGEIIGAKQTTETVLTNFPSEAKKVAEERKARILAQKHECSFHVDGHIYTVIDETMHHKTVCRSKRAAERTDSWGFETLAKLYPKSAELLGYMAETYEDGHNLTKAIECYRQWMAVPSTNGEVAASGKNGNWIRARLLSHYAYDEIMLKHYDTAIQISTKAIALEPADLTAYTNRAKLYQMTHRPDLANQDTMKYRQLMQARREQEAHSSNLALSSDDLKYFSDASFFEKAILGANLILNERKADGPALLERARAYTKIGQYNKAISDYKALLPISKNAQSIKDEMALAMHLAKSGPPPYGDLSIFKDPYARVDYDLVTGKKILHSLADIAADHKGDYRVYEALCNALKKKSQIKVLDAELSKMLEIDPSDKSFIIAKIQTTEGLTKWPEAEKWCTRYMSIFGDSEPFNIENLQYAYSVRARARKAGKNLNGAISDLSVLLEFEPDSAEGFRDRADCYMASGNYKKAVSDYTQSIQNDDSKTGKNYLLRALAYDKLNQPDLAKQDRETAINPVSRLGR